MDPTKNPFGSGESEQHALLVGRDAELGRLRQLFGNLSWEVVGDPIVVTGMAGVGRSAFCRAAAALAEDEKCSSAVLRVAPGQPLAGLVAVGFHQALASLVAKRPGSLAIPSIREALDRFCTARAEESAAFDGAASFPTLEPLLRRLLTTIGDAALDVGGGLALVIDDLHVATPEEAGALLRAVAAAQSKRSGSVVLASSLPHHPALAGAPAAVLELAPLGVDEVAEAVRVPARREHAAVADEAVAALAERTGGYPRLLAAYAHHTWNASPAPPLTAVDVEAAVGAAEADLAASFYRPMLEPLTAGQRRYLRALSELGGVLAPFSEIARRLGDNTRFGAQGSQLAGVGASLIERGLIHSPDGARQSFSVPFLGEHLRTPG
ncbi:MAG: ATP-binding protein [Acidimicrobiales bacterium]